MIRVVMAGATGWVGRALVPAIVAAPDLELAGAVARKAAGQRHRRGDRARAERRHGRGDLEEALAAPSDVVVDYTRADVVKAERARDRQRPACRDRHVRPRRRRLCRDRPGGCGRQGVGVFAAGNFSITATLLRRFALKAARHVADVEIIDYATPASPTRLGNGARARRGARRRSAARRASKPVETLSGMPRDARRRGRRGANGGVQRALLCASPPTSSRCEAVFGARDERLTIRHDAGRSAAPYVAGTLLAIVAENPACGAGSMR